MTDNSNDCLECRLISGFGLIGVSAYIYYQAKHRKKWEVYTMKTLSAGKFFYIKGKEKNAPNHPKIIYLKSAKYKILGIHTPKLKFILSTCMYMYISRCCYVGMCPFTQSFFSKVP